MRATCLPLPPTAEQQEILEAIEDTFSIARTAEGAASRQLRRSDKLRQSILKQAFEGKLVEQDPSEEPASKLLARIQEEREKEQAKTNSKPKRRKEAVTSTKPAGRKKSRTKSRQPELF